MSPEMAWLVSVALVVVLLTRGWWAPWADRWLTTGGRAAGKGRRWRWYLLGYPVTVVRMRLTWRRLCHTTGLAVARRPRYTILNRDAFVMGGSLRPVPPWLGAARPLPGGLRVRVRLHPGQVPQEVTEAADAIAHAWRVHAVRVASPRRGHVVLTATARDPLAEVVTLLPDDSRRVLAAVVGRLEDGVWLIDFRAVPHWLIVGATQSGKSTLLAALVVRLAPQPVALVGIDLKGGMELSLFRARLSALATSREDAVELLGRLLRETQYRMDLCSAAGVRSVWDLPPDDRPLPVVVIVDEVAELYLSDGTREGKRQAAECSSAMLRAAQLGRALGVHLVVAGQRVGSDLGPGVTALRAQLGGRICHRVNDAQSAEMCLGDLHPEAVAVAQQITEDERGVAVTTAGGRWVRARSANVSPEQAQRTAERYAHRTPVLAALNPVNGSSEGSA
jgi:S-DNA-T family DNA segregation ATPase FtsK/SpoIIIE